MKNDGALHDGTAQNSAECMSSNFLKVRELLLFSDDKLVNVILSNEIRTKSYHRNNVTAAISPFLCIFYVYYDSIWAQLCVYTIAMPDLSPVLPPYRMSFAVVYVL